MPELGVKDRKTWNLSILEEHHMANASLQLALLFHADSQAVVLITRPPCHRWAWVFFGFFFKSCNLAGGIFSRHDTNCRLASRGLGRDAVDLIKQETRSCWSWTIFLKRVEGEMRWGQSCT